MRPEQAELGVAGMNHAGHAYDESIWQTGRMLWACTYAGRMGQLRAANPKRRGRIISGFPATEGVKPPSHGERQAGHCCENGEVVPRLRGSQASSPYLAQFVRT